MLKIYNSLAREKQEFIPLNPPNVSFYSCGPTVYGEFHVGNARTFVAGDVIRRWLLASGYAVRYVQNITDVDDKIINRAKAEGVQPEDIALKYTDYFFEKLKQLGNLPADAHPRATQYIGPMISMIRKLEQKGCAYATEDGSVWFSVASFPEYGKLSRRPLDQMQQGERGDAAIAAQKKSPLDFGLWKAVKPGEPAWASPWGKGRPGWHIECSCMAMKTFDAETIDLHAGGADLLFPHHENEIAQSEALTGKQFARYWAHSGMLDMDGEKMSKSLGNIKTIDDVLGIIDPLTLRYFLMSARYRDKIDFTDDNLHKCQSAMERTLTAAREAKRTLGGKFAGEDFSAHDELKKLWEEFAEGMDDDFNTPRALAALAKTTTLLNTARLEAEKNGEMLFIAAALTLLTKMRDTLGLGEALERSVQDVDAATADGLRALITECGGVANGAGTGDELMAEVIRLRAESRKAKNFAVADKIRGRLTELKIALEDKADGTVWKISR
ncbi:cysteine--tRNA ligase [soil metagenome]